MPRNKHDRRGGAFTLIEVLVALSILAMASAVIVQTVTNARLPLISSSQSELRPPRGLQQLSIDLLHHVEGQESASGTVMDHPEFGEISWRIRSRPSHRSGLEEVEVILDPSREPPISWTTLRFRPQSISNNR